MLVDTHCHLEARRFPDGIDAVLERARASRVLAFVTVGVSGTEAAREAVELARRRADVVAVIGVAPHDAAECGEDLAAIEPWLADPCVVGIGETGLEYHHDFSPRPIQHEVFRRSIHMARRVHKPLVIHTREAAAPTLEILVSEGAAEVGGIIHCFSEDRAFAERALDLDFDLGFSGMVTFRNASALREVAAWAPLDRMVVETDSPYLSPEPLRKRRCEPAFVVHTARVVAEARGISLEALAEATTQNACRRFGSALAEAVEASRNLHR